MIEWQVPDAGEHTASFFPTVLTSEPAWSKTMSAWSRSEQKGGIGHLRLAADHHAEEQDDGWQSLQCKRHNVLHCALAMLEGSIIDPERNTDSRYDEELVHASEGSSDRSRCVLRGVKWRDHTCSSNAYAGDESGNKSTLPYSIDALIATYLPVYITPKYPTAAACMTDPMIARIAAIIRPPRRPNRSAT